MREDGPVPASVDLNCDLGESFGVWELGDDASMLDTVSSANVACGFHAGDPPTMLRTCRLAAERGVAVGAHPAYRDLAGFGRRDLAIEPDDLYADVLYQLGALQAVARAAGTGVGYVKPHGALFHRVARDDARAAAVAWAARDAGGLPLLGLAGTAIDRAAADAGVRFVAEAYLDRAYTDGGMLVPRGEPGAVLDDPDVVAERAVRLASGLPIATRDGGEVVVDAASLCVHGDTPGAVGMAQAVRSALAAAGIGVESFL